MVDERLLSKQPLGNTGLAVTPLSLGTVKLGRDVGVKYPTPVKIPSDKEAIALLDCAYELGINLLDTAPAYGISEERLGKLLPQATGDFLLCTKVGEDFVDGQSVHNFSPEHCQLSIERSLRALQKEVLDIVLIHSNGEDVSILRDSGVWETLLSLKQAGKIRAIGMSHKTLAGGEAALALNVDVIMASLSFGFRKEAKLIADAHAQGCGVLIKKALDSGHSSSAGLAYVASQPGVDSIVIGTTNPKHLIENARVVAETTC